jgi:hypothetical protein
MKKVFFAIIISLFTLSCTDNNQKIDDLSWLEGNWNRKYSGNTQIERWDAQGNDLLGISSFANGVDTTEMVTFQIQQKEGKWVLVTKDVDFEQEIVYHLASVNSDSMLFINNGTEWPKTIKYKQLGGKTLIKTVSGQQGSMKKEIELTFNRSK